MDWENLVIPCWLLAALLIMFVWPFRPNRYFDKFDWRFSDWNTRSWPDRLIVGFIGFSAFTGLKIVLSDGLKAVLVFLPTHVNNEGPSIRARIASFIGLLLEILIISLLLKHNKKRREALHGREGRNGQT
jgi:hypothetical protein